MDENAPGTGQIAGRARLLAPGRIGPVALRNRVVMAAMTTRAADADGFVTEDAVAYYRARAAGGVGLVTVEMASPERVGRHRRHELGIHDDAFLPGLATLVGAIHAQGARASIQLGHGGGHTRRDICGETPIAPSAIPHVVQEGTTQTIVPEAMSRARIARTVAAFAAAARRARQAGFDAVEIHAAHGYLISQFLTPAENLRADEYGGSLANRARFALEVVRAVRDAVPGLAVIFRVNGDDYIPGAGLTPAEAGEVCAWAAEAGADAIHVTGGHYRSTPSGAVMIPPMGFPDGMFLPVAAAVRRRVGVPVIGVGRLGDPEAAARAVEDGHVDFVALGRPLLADPDWVRNVAEGRAVRACIACNTCVDGMRTGGKLHCLVNAAAGRERAFDASGRPRGRRIAVVGAGPAGLTYASLVAEGNAITVFEREPEPGGALRVAGLAPLFQGVAAEAGPLLRYVEGLARRCQEDGVRFEYATDPIRAGGLDGFDHIVVATGAAYRRGWGPPIAWMVRGGALRWPGLRRLASAPRVRAWFYTRAREPTEHLWRAAFGDRLIAIGDAAAPGKAQDAVLAAFRAAHGLADRPECRPRPGEVGGDARHAGLDH